MTRQLQKISKYRPSELQQTLQLEAMRPRVGLAIEHPYERRARSILTIIFIVLIAAYLYFVAASILNVMAEREAEGTSAHITGSIGSLEQQYFALSSAVTPQEGQALGLVPVAHTAYVQAPGNTAEVAPQSSEI